MRRNPRTITALTLFWRHAALIFFSFGCDESSSQKPNTIQNFSNLVAKIYGGEFLDATADQNTSSIELSIAPQSIETHLDFVINDCSLKEIHIQTGRDLTLYELKVRVYIESEQETRFSENTLREYITEGGQFFRPISDVFYMSGEELTQRNQNTLSSNSGSWHIKLSQADKRFSLTANELTTTDQQTIDPLSRTSRLDQRICAQAKQSDRRRLLIRQELSYRFENRFQLAFVHFNPKESSLETLNTQLSSLEDLGVDGVSLAYMIEEEPNNSDWVELRSILNQSKLLWLITPIIGESSELGSWREYFGGDSFSFEMNHVRLMYLNTSRAALSESQLDQISLWVNDRSISPYISEQVHTRALVVHTPLINLDGGRDIRYKPGALRVLNELRSAHMTHQIIDRSAFDKTSALERSELGTQVLLSPSSANDPMLILSIDTQCERDLKGERCFEYRWLE